METHARVFFDEAAVAEDVLGSGRNGAAVLRATRLRYERTGVPLASLRRCEAEGRDSTQLPGCLKVYLPAPDGKFGMVLVLARRRNRLELNYLAFGVRHHPKGSHAERAYEVADRRLHG